MKGKEISFPFFTFEEMVMNRTIKRLIPLALAVLLSSVYVLLLSKNPDYYRALLSAGVIQGEADYINALLFWLVGEVALPVIFALYLYFILPRTEENGIFRAVWGVLFFAEAVRTGFTKTGAYRILRILLIAWILWSLFQKKETR